MMALDVGDMLPDANLLVIGAEGPASVALSEKAKDRKIVLFAVPGAYTGVCTTAHVPSFIKAKDDLAAKGIDEVICVSVNDPFVMQAWGEATGASEAGITMLGDAESTFTKAMGMDFSAPPVGLMARSKRYALVAENGKITHLQVEDSPGECTISAGNAIVEALG